MDLEILRRAVAANPEDVGARVSLLKARARVEGPEVYLEILAERLLWQSAPEVVQDMTIEVVSERLAGFAHSSTELWRSGAESSGHRLATFTHHATGVEFQLIPGTSETHCWVCVGDNQHCRACYGKGQLTARLPLQPFFMSRRPITLKQRDNGHTLSDNPALPWTSVDWDDAAAWLEDFSWRFPSSTEWLYACRAGSLESFYWGPNFDPAQVWFAGNCRRAGELFQPTHPQPVNIHEEQGLWNDFGLIDMIGNVWEWVRTDFGQGHLGGSFDSSEGMLWYESGQLDDVPIHEVGLRACFSVPVR